MTHSMEEKLQMLESYINKLDTAVSENDIAKARSLQREIIAVYDPEIESLRGGLDSHDVFHSFQNAPPVDYIGDAILLRVYTCLNTIDRKLYLKGSTMVKDMIDDPIFLARKSEVATKEDFQAAQDLLDTLIAHKDTTKCSSWTWRLACAGAN